MISKRALHLLTEMHRLFGKRDFALLDVPAYSRGRRQGGGLARQLERLELIETWYDESYTIWHSPATAHGRVTDKGRRFLKLTAEFGNALVA